VVAVGKDTALLLKGQDTASTLLADVVSSLDGVENVVAEGVEKVEKVVAAAASRDGGKKRKRGEEEEEEDRGRRFTPNLG
jgi:ribosomal protein L12E/L44/L45/RPP1/RPP2